MKLWIFTLLLYSLTGCFAQNTEKINRQALVERNSPHINSFDSLASLSVGNGNFAFTVDATGLQTFPDIYAAGVPLGTQSQWGWHSFVNNKDYRVSETLKNYNFRGKEEPYAIQFKEPGRQQEAANWYRENPHRLHLGYVGLELVDNNGKTITKDEITNIHQELKLWNGIISSRFTVGNDSVSVRTSCNPQKDQIAAEINSDLFDKNLMKINFRFAYPTGNHTDGASNWNVPEKHKTEIVFQNNHSCVLKRTIDTSVYFVSIQWKGDATIFEKKAHYFVLSPKNNHFSFTCEFLEKAPKDIASMNDDIFSRSTNYWQQFWKTGGAIDFSKCKDKRAKELERRVVLSQYLMAIQCSGNMPPQETGLTYNSWFGKFHLEMHWWHAVHFALWNRTDLLERSMDWYAKAYPMAKSIAQRQGFKGIRWMKMTDPSAKEAPSSVGSFLIWQQPHFIYMAELIYRNKPSKDVINKYGFLVEETAEFMNSFADYDTIKNRYVLKGIIPAQETLRASETINPPFELSYWHYALSVAQQWRERAGKPRNADWDKVLEKLSPLTAKDGLYLAAEDAVDTYKDIRFTSDHPAVLGALGILPQCKLVRADYMKNTLDCIWDKWNWDVTWGWDYPMVAMSAARLGEPERAVGALLMDKKTNTYLVNGHNYKDERLRIYLPGNGGLLTAVSMMCAGWDGNKIKNPGFPTDGNWNVVWEGLRPMP